MQESVSNIEKLPATVGGQSLEFKIFVVKFRCILLFTFALLTLIEFVIIIASTAGGGEGQKLNITALFSHLTKFSDHITS
jgi:uncharacterized membrane protein